MVPLPIHAAGFRDLDTSLIELLTILVAALAALGVLNAMILAVRERVHELGVVKAVGMTPRQTVIMVLLWAAAPSPRPHEPRARGPREPRTCRVGSRLPNRGRPPHGVGKRSVRPRSHAPGAVIACLEL
ncbi:MAG: FtsX-like permease family protein [Streptosporangiaceae bacterium]